MRRGEDHPLAAPPGAAEAVSEPLYLNPFFEAAVVLAAGMWAALGLPPTERLIDLIERWRNMGKR